MRTTTKGALSLLAMLAVPAAELAGGVAFTTKPSATRAGGKVKIIFAVSVATDVEVAILDAKGKVVRHLAAGVLGAEAAPPPPLRKGLSQGLEWDMTDDFGKPARGGPFKVRVRAGTGVKFARFIGADDPHTFGLVSSMISDKQGNLYVMGFREEDFLGAMTLRVFSPQGKYLRTIMPFPADLAPGAMKDVAVWDAAKKCLRPRNFANLNPQFYTHMGRSGGFMHLISASAKKGILLTDSTNLYRLDARGAVSGDKFAVRNLWPRGKPRYGRPPRWGWTFTAVSPDGRYLYLSGRYSAKSQYGHRLDPNYPPGVVYRMDLNGSGVMEPFVTIKVAHKDGQGGNWTKDYGNYTSYGVSGFPKGPVHGVAVDAEGRVYVCDRENGRVAVFDEKGNDAGHIKVRFPDYVFVHPKTGAVYVLEKRSAGRGTPFTLKLLKFNSVKPDARPSAEFDIPRADDKVVMTASFPKGRALFWIRTSTRGRGKYRLVALEDKGKSFEQVETDYRPRKDSQWGWHRLATDWARDEVYGSDGTVGMWRYDGKTGKGVRLMKDGKPFWSQDLAVGYDGLLYARRATHGKEFQAYSGPFARYTRDLEPVPFSGTGTHVLSKYIYSREGPGYAERGIGVSPDGKVYISWMFWGWVKYAVTGFGSDGRPLKGKYLAGKGHPGNYSRGTPKKLDSAIIGPITGSNGGIRVDLDGNIYIGMWIWPKDVPVPKQWAGNAAYLASAGSVFKFGPAGGFLSSPRKDWSSDPCGGTPRTPGAKGIEARSGKGGGGFYDAFVQGALAAYPGYAPFSHQGFAGNTCCVCRGPRFDLDRYGRLYLPNAITNSVRILDNAGNEILEFGKYGNFDSGYVNANLAAGRSGRPTVAAPAIPLGWPTATGVSKDALYVCDTLNRRAVRVVFTHAAEAVCDLK